MLRPFRHLGGEVWMETSMTVRPASRSSLDTVPPVERSSTFWDARYLQKGTMLVLSETEIRARVMGMTLVWEPAVVLVESGE